MKNKLAKALAFIFLFIVAVPTVFCEKGKIDPFHMQIVGKYFENLKDYQKLEMVNKKFKDIVSYYRENNIPLTEENYKFFENLETYIAHPGESKAINKLGGKISHLVYLENSFNSSRFYEIMMANGINPRAVKIIKPEAKFSLSSNWEMKIIPFSENQGCKILFLRDNKDKIETITFYLDVFMMSCYRPGEFNLDMGLFVIII